MIMWLYPGARVPWNGVKGTDVWKCGKVVTGEMVHGFLRFMVYRLVQDGQVTCRTVVKFMGPDEMEWKVSWGERKVRYDVGGGVGSIGVDEASFAKEVEGEQVVEEIKGGAGGVESESANDVTVVGLNLKKDGGVVLNPNGLYVEYFEASVVRGVGGMLHGKVSVLRN